MDDGCSPPESSRLIILNLPPTLSPSALRSHLEDTSSPSNVHLTDLKLNAKRRFAFVGYRDEEEAKKVKEWFDGTYLGSGKIKVDYVDDNTLTKRHQSQFPHRSTPKSTVTTSTNPANANSIPVSAPKPRENKNLNEFLNVMKGVDPTLPVTPEAGTETGGADAAEKRGKKRKVGGPTEEQNNQDESGVVGVVEVAQNEELDDAEWLRRKQAAATAAAVQASSGEGGDNSTGLETLGLAPPPASSLTPEESLILQTSRLFLRNLPHHATATLLNPLLSPYGTTTEVHLPTSKTTGEPLGTAFVRFESGEEAVNAWRGLDGKVWGGRVLHALPGRGKPGESSKAVVGAVAGSGVAGSEAAAGDGKGTANTGSGLFGRVLGREDGKNVKAEVDKRRKEESRKGLNWATLYMNSDAVASSVASRLGLSKADILNSEAGIRGDEKNDDDDKGFGKGVGSAVKLALAETSVINDTKKYFTDHGVVLDRLEGVSDVITATGTKAPSRAPPRSRTMLLVKNIPYGTSLDVLRALFAPYGEMSRLLMPPAGTLAVVEYENEEGCTGAFKGLAYKRLGNAVIYLERAPGGLIRDDAPVEQESKPVASGSGANEADEVKKRIEAVGETAKDPEAGNEPGSTLYVKNLSFETTQEKMTSVFTSLPAFAFARVSTKPDPKNPTGRLSMGFGFLGFRTRVAAEKALKGLKGFRLDGHELEFKFAKRDREGEEGGEGEKGKGKGGVEAMKKGKTTKMIVKNMPFEASKKDIKDLFSAYGTLKSCRIPKKHNSSGRGFAFLDFTTRSEAEAAMEALKHTHLLGRHLVLEWSTGDDFAEKEVDRLREKAKRDLVREGEGPQKKRKLGVKDGRALGAEEDSD